MTNQNDLPRVRLKPKTDARALRRGFPWVYSDQLVTDRRTRNLVPGTVAVLEDQNRAGLGLVAVNPGSKIICRLLDRSRTAEIDIEWVSDRLRRALSHRSRLYPEPFYRLIHAEADGLPGVIVDRFGDAVVVQPNAAWADMRIDMIAEALISVCDVKTVIMNGTGRARALEGLDERSEVLRGPTPKAPIAVSMNGAVYLADVLGGQKTGLFFDQRPNHAFAAGLAKGAVTLDVFSHVGGFGLAALANGATSAMFVDGSQPALDLVHAGAERMGVAQQLTTRKGDAFDVLAKLAEDGATFDLVVCDPPAFAPSKQALEAGLRAYERVARLAAPLVAAGGYLCLCSCSHAADLSAFRNASSRGIARAGRRAQIIHTGAAGPDHPVLPQLAETSYLKAIFYRL